MNIKSTGACKYCQKEFTGSSMTRHLQSCKNRKKAIEPEKRQSEIFLIRAGQNPFWLYFEVNAFSTLDRVDNFLREIWLECCGHMSAFEINGARYASNPCEDFDEMGMDVQLIDVLQSGIAFRHEYDFGSTTKLTLKCLSKREGKCMKKIELIARNNLPDFRCACGKPATNICSYCDDEWLLCGSCTEKHECEEDLEMYLRVVNSPRMGVCGYGG